MRIVRVPTCLIMKYPSCRHLFGKWWYDAENKLLVKGDKTLRQKTREIQKAIDKPIKL